MRRWRDLLIVMACCASLSRALCGATSPLLQACDSILEKSWDFAPTSPYCTDIATAIQSGSRATFNGPLMIPNCRLQWFETDKVCGVMSKHFPHVMLVGSSLMRHMSNAFLILTSGNAVNGSYNPASPPSQVHDCACELQFNDGHIVDDEGVVHTNVAAKNIMKCRDLSLYDSDDLSTPICPGLGVNIHHSWYPEKSRANRTLYVLGGAGLHTDFNLTAFEDGMLNPAIKLVSNQQGDAIICVTTHSQGPNKPVKYVKRQGNPTVLIYNTGLRALCEKHGFPVLDFFPITKNTTTWDGVHFGLAPNVLKAQIVLNWMNTRQMV